MKKITVAAACINQTPLDWQGNLARIRAAIQEAKERGTHVLCLPELVTTGYGCEDMFLSKDTVIRAEEILAELLQEAPNMLIAVGLPFRYNNTVFNTCAYIHQGAVLGLYAKQNLAGDGEMSL